MLKLYKEDTLAPPPQLATVTEPPTSDVKEAARLLVGSKQPVIIAEHAGKKPGVVKRLTELAELLSIPVFEARMPYAANFPKENLLYMGSDTTEALKLADTVMVVGGLTPWYPPSDGPGDDTRIIMIDEAPLHERLPYWGYRTDMIISADIGKTLEAMVSIIRSETEGKEGVASTNKERLENWRAKHDAVIASQEQEALAGKERKPINPGWFLYVARKTFQDDAIILNETLSHSNSVHQYIATPDCYIKSAYGGLGIGMGEAAGVKLANPDRPVILVVGDGSFNYNPVLAALGCYQEYNLPVFIIIMNNGGYLVMKWAQKIRYPRGAAVNQNRFLGTDITPAPDYVKVAEAFGAYGEKLEDPGEIEAALKRGLEQIAQGKTALLDVILEEILPPQRGKLRSAISKLKNG